MYLVNADCINEVSIKPSAVQFIPFLDYDVEIRRVICSTNAIESLNARYQRAVKARVISLPNRLR